MWHCWNECCSGAPLDRAPYSFYFAYTLTFFRFHLVVASSAGYIDLSKRRVATEEIVKCEQRWNKSKSVQSIMTRVAKAGAWGRTPSVCVCVTNAMRRDRDRDRDREHSLHTCYAARTR